MFDLTIHEEYFQQMPDLHDMSSLISDENGQSVDDEEEEEKTKLCGRNLPQNQEANSKDFHSK